MSLLFGSFGSILLAACIISLISFIGAFLLLKQKSLIETITSLFVSFAAGVMLGATFLDILPEAFELGRSEQVLPYILAGIVVSFMMERFVLFYHHHHEEKHNIHPSAYLVIIGDGIHNFIDGVAIAAAFLTNPALGVTATIAIAAHEIPQEIADISILSHAGMSRGRALVFNFLSALTAVVGAVLGYLFFSSFIQVVPLALGVTGGMFIYIACADLIPELHRESKGEGVVLQTTLLFVGMMLMFFLTRIIAE